MILYFDVRDSKSLLSMAHSVCVTYNDAFSLSVRKDEMSDYCLILSVLGSEYLIEKSSHWLDSSHMSFYWRERVLSSFNQIVSHFSILVSCAANHDDSYTINITSLLKEEYKLFEKLLS